VLQDRWAFGNWGNAVAALRIVPGYSPRPCGSTERRRERRTDRSPHRHRHL